MSKSSSTTSTTEFAGGSSTAIRGRSSGSDSARCLSDAERRVRGVRGAEDRAARDEDRRSCLRDDRRGQHVDPAVDLDGNGDTAIADRIGRLPDLGHDLAHEEHTSELQSLAYLVCRLLLEKKKKE